MHHIFHQFKKDLTHQRWALLAWATLLLLHLLVTGFQILRHVPNPQASTDQFADLVASWVVFFPMLFVILVVQSDTPVGSSAFWLTRPLRGGQMLAAKSLFVILLFVILPLAVEMTVLLLRGAGTKAWLLLPEFSVLRLPVVLAAFALGAASKRFLHALTLAATGCALSIATVLLGYYIFYGGPGGSTPQPFSGSRGIVALWTLAATFATVVAVQFLTRREGFGRSLFAVGIATAMILQLVWPWNILGRSPQIETSGSDPIALQIDPARMTIGSVQQSRGRGAASRFITFPIGIAGGRQSAGEFLAPVSSQVELATASSSTLTESSDYYLGLEDSSYRGALESLLAPDQIRLVPPPGNPGTADSAHVLSHSFRMSNGPFDQYQRDLEEIEVTVDVGLFGLERSGELPLRYGAKWSEAGDQLEIVRMRWATRSNLQIKIRTQVLSLIFAARATHGRQEGDSTVLVLANRNTNTAIVLDPIQSAWRSRGTGWISPFFRTVKTIDLNLRTELGQSFTLEAAKDWRENSTLIIVRKRQLGSVRVGRAIEATEIYHKP